MEIYVSYISGYIYVGSNFIKTHSVPKIDRNN